MRLVVWLVAVIVVAGSLIGCGPGLGQCNSTNATFVVYAADGTPYFEGQALVAQSCAGGFCHAVGAVGAGRLGAPHGMNFDIGPLVSTNPMTTSSDLSVLRAGIAKTREYAVKMYDLVEAGTMPPAGVGARPTLVWKRQLVGVNGLVDAQLPAVGTAAGTEILRNWLACNAPIVSATPMFPDQVSAMQLGTVVAPVASAMTATFQSIYDSVLNSKCAGCHNPTGPYANLALDFTNVDAAYASLSGKSANATSVCTGKGQLVVPGNCQGSLLYEKLVAPPVVCGSPMPLAGATLPTDTLNTICSWIMAGATRQ